MDNKITKRRLSDFLSYEWIIMIVVAVACIIVWELVFTMTSVRVSVGQDFKFYYDQTVYSGSSNKMYSLFVDEEDPERTIFSYDVFKVSHEALVAEYNVLNDRLSVQEGDILITDCVEPEKDAEDKSVRAKTIIDSKDVYDFQSLLEDAETYLSQFLKDGLNKDSVDVADFDNHDGQKIENLFRERMKKDNRFRSEEQKITGIKLEKERISDLCDEVKKFRVLLSQGDEYFYMYSRYEQLLERGVDEKSKEYYEYNRDKEDKRYGLRVENLTGGTDPSEYFKLNESDTAKDVVVLVFDFLEYQPHLQFEAIAFINAIVGECSNLYDGI